MGKACPAFPAPPEAPARAVPAGAIPVLPEGWICRHTAGKRELPSMEPPNTSSDSCGVGMMGHKQEPGGCLGLGMAPPAGQSRGSGLARALETGMELVPWERKVSEN